MLRVIRFACLGVGLPTIVVAAVEMAMPSVAGAATITVNNATDPVNTSGNGFCTLREAIDNANSPGADTTGGDCALGTGNDTINFSVSGTIRLASTLPSIVNTRSPSTGQDRRSQSTARTVIKCLRSTRAPWSASMP